MIELPRVEAEFNWNGKFGEKNNAKIFINGAAQTAKDGVTGTTNSMSSAGFGGGIVLDFSGFALSGSGFWAKGMGSLFMGDAFAGDRHFDNRWRGRRRRGPQLVRLHRPAHLYARRPASSSSAAASARTTSSGPTPTRRAGGTGSEILKRRAIVGQITYKWSKSLRWVFEYGHIDGYGDGVKDLEGRSGLASA